MKDQFRYDNTNDAYQHLSHTVVIGKEGIPFFLSARSHHKWDWYVQEVGGDEREVLDIRKIGLTFEPIQLGYCNHNSTCSYLIRRPVRMWKQGLSYDHVKAKTGYLDDDLFISEFLRNTITNKYPNIKESYAKVKNHGWSSAFHRDFAFTGNEFPLVQIEYKGDHIGYVNEDGDLDIKDKFFFVKEQLEEVIRASN